MFLFVFVVFLCVCCIMWLPFDVINNNSNLLMQRHEFRVRDNLMGKVWNGVRVMFRV